MVKTSTSLASFFRPHGGGSDDLFAAKLHRREIKVAEIRHNSNIINIDNIASAPLARDLQHSRLSLLTGNLLAAGVSVINTLGVSGKVSINVNFSAQWCGSIKNSSPAHHSQRCLVKSPCSRSPGYN